MKPVMMPRPGFRGPLLYHIIVPTMVSGACGLNTFGLSGDTTTTTGMQSTTAQGFESSMLMVGSP
jgi:hypothetical protein